MKLLTQREQHGGSRIKVNGKWRTSKLYAVWSDAKYRCYRKSHPSYYLYGAHGVRMCKSWYHSFTEFQSWAMLNGYEEGLRLMLVNKSESYKPSNCRFATHSEIQHNRRTSPLTKADVEMMHNKKREFGDVWKWAKQFNVTASYIQSIIKGENWDDVKFRKTNYKDYDFCNRKIGWKKRKEISEKCKQNMIEQFKDGRRKVPEFCTARCGTLKTVKGGVVQYRSLWERSFAKKLDATASVIKFRYERRPIEYQYNGEQHFYFPDFEVEFRNGRKMIIEIKAPYLLTHVESKAQQFVKLQAAEKFCKENGFEYRLLLHAPPYSIHKIMKRTTYTVTRALENAGIVVSK